MKFKSKPMKVEQQQESHNHHNNHHHHHHHPHHLGTYSSSGSEVDLNEVVSTTADPCLSPADLKHLTKLPSPSPIRSADEDSGVGGSPGCNNNNNNSSNRPVASNCHSCNVCHKKFSRADILRKHVKTHVNSSCSVCGQIFNDKVALAKHQSEVHTLDRVFQCPQCEKGFKELRTLRLHLKIHNAEYPEQCSVCQKVFRTKWQLKQHQMDHGGERPYPCPECSFTCKTKQQLNEHRRKHSGEKAYSCSQCGTRFTYRNGLIKHTKLNRCPKKIITPEGETIIKKRSRTFGPSKSKLEQQQINQNNSNKNNIINNCHVVDPNNATSSFPLPVSASTVALNQVTHPASTNSIDNKLTLQSSTPSSLMAPSTISGSASTTSGGAILHNSDICLLPVKQEVGSDTETATATAHHPQHPVDQQHPTISNSATLFVQDQQIQLHANGDTYGLTVLEDGSLVATPQQQQQKPNPNLVGNNNKLRNNPGGVASALANPAHLSPNVIAALSAATGLPANEIYSWAANLPAGSTVKVTHHFENSNSTSSGSNSSSATAVINANAKTALTSIRQTSPTVTTSRVQLQADRLMDHVLRQQRQQLTLEMANTCHDSLISSCVGLPSYQESFAVDPNEILSRERGTKTLSTSSPTSLVIKQEPMTPTFDTNEEEDDLNNNNNMEEDDLNNLDFPTPQSHNNHSFNFYTSHRPPSVINMANSRLLNMAAASSSSGMEALAASSLIGHGSQNSASSTSSSSIMIPSPLSSSLSSSISSSPCNSRGPNSTVQSHLLMTTTNSFKDHHQGITTHPDFDLDEMIPVNFLDDMDLCGGFNINDQDFTSMKSIVEQTFKDGRDVMDIISAV